MTARLHESPLSISRLRGVALALVAALALGACGGGSDSTPVDPALKADADNAAIQVAASGAEASLAVDAARAVQSRAADPHRVRQVIVFGDSLSDVGTYRVGPVAAAGGGKYTTNPGPIWAETLALVFGTRVTPFKQGGFGVAATIKGGTGYAMGGARVALDPGYGCGDYVNGTCSRQLSESMLRQVQDHVKTHGKFTDDQLVLVLAGPNDIFYHLDQTGVTETPEQAVTATYLSALALVEQLKALKEAGAKRIVVLNVPPMEATPFAKSSGPQATQFIALMVDTFNKTFAGAFAQANIPGVVVLDLYAETQKMLANPHAYLIRDTENTACDLSKLPAPSSLFCSPKTLVAPLAPLTFMFADAVHPTTLTHLNIARFVLVEMWRARML